MNFKETLSEEIKKKLNNYFTYKLVERKEQKGHYHGINTLLIFPVHFQKPKKVSSCVSTKQDIFT